MKKRIFCGGALFILAVIAISTAATQELEINNDLKNGKVLVHRIFILRPEASVTMFTMKGAIQAVDETRETEKRLREAVAGVMRGKNCEVMGDDSGDAAQDADARNFAISLQNGFNELLPHLTLNPADVRKGRFTLGDEVLNFAPGASADALIFVHADGVLATGGKAAFSAVVGGPGLESISIRLAVVDSRNGAVLYYGKAFGSGDFLADSGELSAVALNALMEFPDSIEAKKKAHK